MLQYYYNNGNYFDIKGAFQAYHVPPIEHVDLAARYGPEDILVTTKKLTPSFFHTFYITVLAIWP